MRRRVLNVLAVLLPMLAVLLLFTFPLLSSDRLLFMGDVAGSDITELNFPARNLLARSLRGGSLPLWDPDIGCGLPLLAEGQSGMFYPLNLLLFRAFTPVLAFNLSVVASLLLALVFAYLLARLYGASRLSALFAAVAFAFSGYVVSKLKFTCLVNSIAWLPLAVYGLEKVFRSGKPKFLLLTALALAMQALAGGPQVFFITVCLLAVILAWRLAALLREAGAGAETPRGRLAARLLACFVLALILSITLAAPQVIPQAAGYPFFNRSEGLASETSISFNMRPASLSLFFSPYQDGNPAYGTYDLGSGLFWEDIAYPGLLTLVLALVALLFLSRRDRDAGLWLLVSVLALAVSLGDNTPLARFLWNLVPGFKMFRFYQRFLVVTVLGMSLLAAKGLDHVLRKHGGDRVFRTCIALLALAVLVTDLGLFARRQVSTIDAEEMLAPGPAVQFLRENLGERGEYRYVTLGEDAAWEKAYRQAGGWMGDKDPYFEYFSFLPANFSGNFDLPNARQYGAYGLTPVQSLDAIARYGRVEQGGGTARLPQCAVASLAVQGVRYVITPLSLEGEGLLQVQAGGTDAQNSDLRIYEVENALPRASVFTSYEVVEGMESLTVLDMGDLFFPPSRVNERVILEEEPPFVFEPGAPEAGRARIVSSGADRVVIEAEAPRGGLLVLSDAYYPEWRATVDGEEREVLKANVAFRAVALEPGTHRVEFALRPASLHYGFLVGAAGLALLALLFFYGHRTRWFRPFGPSP